MTTTLPTADEMIRNADAKLSEAYQALNDAADWLQKDWTPTGSPLTDLQARQRNAMRDAIKAARAAINGSQQ